MLYRFVLPLRFDCVIFAIDALVEAAVAHAAHFVIQEAVFLLLYGVSFHDFDA